MADPLQPRCDWCGKPRRTWSGWEQQGITDKLWKRLCSRCANRRLDNPWNALLPMRRIVSTERRHQEAT